MIFLVKTKIVFQAGKVAPAVVKQEIVQAPKGLVFPKFAKFDENIGNVSNEKMPTAKQGIDKIQIAIF